MGLAGYVIGMLNVMTMFVGVLAVGLGIGLASSGEESECVKFVQWRVVGVGAATLVLSLAGLLGAWYERAWRLLYFYVAAVLLLFLMLLLLAIAALLVTAQAADGVVVGASGHTYQLRSPSSSSSSSSWIESQLRKPGTWSVVKSCILRSHLCHSSALHVSPVQVSCCEWPTSSCQASSPLPTEGEFAANNSATNDCLYWSIDELCLDYNSCKAGVLQSIRDSRDKIVLVSILILLSLIIVFFIGCGALHNLKRTHKRESFFPSSKDG